jgi:1-aminocyclopropane-1-carboxylate deaminase/D-cysteine desulfhydrase-like pyridoxal-dependent ACC family enzyme
MGLVVAATVSTGGLAALAVKLSRKKNGAEIVPNSDERKNQNVDEHD